MLEENLRNLSQKQIRLLWFCKMRRPLREIVSNFSANYYYMALQMRMLYNKGLIRRIKTGNSVSYLTPVNIACEIDDLKQGNILSIQ